MPSTKVSFKKGVKANKPATLVDGSMYIFTDTGELVVKSGNSEVKITDFAVVDELPLVGSQISTKFYYLTTDNSLYRVIDNEWAKIGGGGGGGSYSQGTGITITNAGVIKAKVKSETELSDDSASAVATATANRFYPVQIDHSGFLAVNVPWVAGEAGTVTSVAAGTGLAGGTISTSGTIKANLKSETALTNDSAAATETAGRVYPVAVDKSGYLAVNVPWTDSTPVTSVNSKTGAVVLAASDVGAIASSVVGVASGVAELDANGKVPSSQLPSYVDDVVEGYYNTTDHKFYKESTYTTEIAGETGKIYVDLSTDATYRWSGSAFVAIGSSLALGETSSTAYRGDRGADAYAHAVTNKGSAFTSGLYKITTNAEGHVTAATDVLVSTTASSLASETASSTASRQYPIQYDSNNKLSVNVPWTDTTYSAMDQTEATTGTATTARTITAAVLNAAITAKGYTTNTGTVTSVSGTTGLTGSVSTTGSIKADLVSETKLTNAAAAATETSGRVYPVALDTNGKLAVNVPWTDTTYSVAPQSANGLMSSTDKTTLDNIGALQGITSDPTSVSTGMASSAYLCNYLAGEKVVLNLAVANWSSTTVTINSTAYYYYEVTVDSILVSHPIMFLATDTIPTSDQQSAWSGLEMVADTANSKLVFYATAVPSIAIPVGVRGVVPLAS